MLLVSEKLKFQGSNCVKYSKLDLFNRRSTVLWIWVLIHTEYEGLILVMRLHGY